MNNFKFYVQELKKMFSMYNDYMVDSIITSDDNKHVDYLIPEKVSDVKRKRERKRPYTIIVTRSSPAYDYFNVEFRENRMSEDEYGNFLVPENDYYVSHKTR